MSIFEWFQEQAQPIVNYLIGLRNDVAANVIANLIAAALLAIGAWLLLRLGLRRREQGPPQYDEIFLRRQRQAMLDAVERQWIQGQLERLLHNQAPIFLGITDLPEAVERPWEYDIQTPGQIRRTRDTSAILDVFDDSGSLLILGVPGSGKTFTLLDLARQLIKRGREKESTPLPVVFMLARWAQQKKPLDEWMISEMERQYWVPPPLGRHWMSRHELLPLLDGLDEVEESARDSCVEAINAYRDKAVGGAPVVVCSRQDEYSRLSLRLLVEAAVSLQPLTDQQIEQHVRRLGEQGRLLTGMLTENGALRELARTPLWLDVMTVAYGGTSTATAPEVMAPADIFDAYVRRVLLEHRQPLQEWPPGQCMRWLRWLAQQLERMEQQMLRLEEMQPDWLGEEVKQKRYHRWLRWTVAMMLTLIVTLIGTLGGWLSGERGTGFQMKPGGPWSIKGPGFEMTSVDRLPPLVIKLEGGLLSWLFGGLVAGLIYGLRGRPRHMAEGRFIAPVTGLAWEWREARRGVRPGLMVALVFTLIFGLASWIEVRLLSHSLAFDLPYALLRTGMALGVTQGRVLPPGCRGRHP